MSPDKPGRPTARAVRFTRRVNRESSSLDQDEERVIDDALVWVACDGRPDTDGAATTCRTGVAVRGHG